MLLTSSAIPMDHQIKGLQFVIDLKPTIQNLLHIPMYMVLAVLFLQVLTKYQIHGLKRSIVVLLGAGFILEKLFPAFCGA